MLVLAGTFLVQRRWCCYCTRCVRMFVYIRFTPLLRFGPALILNL
jgi:hypothetical protein